MRTVVLVRQRELLQELAIVPDPTLRLVLALLWGLLFCLLAAGLWYRWSAARPGIPLALAVYGLYQWILLAFFVESPVMRQAWPAFVLTHLLALLLVLWVLYRPGSDRYWQNASKRGNDGNAKN